jgi:FHA domain/von Willebrand factor type A domain
MRRSLVLAGLALCAAASRADAGDYRPGMQRVVIDRVDLEPSPVMGYVRLRVFVSALDLASAGKVLAIYGDNGWTLKLGSSEHKVPYLAGLYENAQADTAIVIVVEKAFEYADDLDNIKQAIDQEVLAKLPPHTQVAVVGYGDELVSGKLGAAKSAQSKLASITSEGSPGAPNLLGAVSKALTLLRRVKTEPEGLPVRKIVLIVSDGRDRDDDASKVTSLGKKAAKDGVRLHAVGYYTGTCCKAPLLNLGELSKQSLGTFRWAQKADGIRQRLQNALLEIDRQYVLTWLVPADEVVGKKLTVTAQVSASQAIESNEAKVPAAPLCAGNECPDDAYCAVDHCVQHAQPKGRGVLGWLLLLGGIGVAIVAVLGGVGVAITRLRRRPPPVPSPQPPGVGAPGPGPAPGLAPAGAPPATGAFAPAAAAPAPAAVYGPQLYMMSGPRSGQRIALRHGFTIGKQPGCDLVLDEDGFASSQHAQILMDTAGNCTLVDKGSTNGTFVNGVRVSQYSLTHGVAIRVGSTELRFLSQ